jgi:GT2 family glycosyltransferase
LQASQSGQNCPDQLHSIVSHDPEPAPGLGVLASVEAKVASLGNGATFRQENGPEEVEAISGACLMLKRTLLELGCSVKITSCTLRTLICYRIRQAGYKNYYVPDATVIHFGGSMLKGRETYQ